MLINFNHLKTFYNALVQKLKSSRGNWEQNDPSADDYIKNRPFYSERVLDTKMQDQFGPFCYWGSFSQEDLNIELIEGQLYHVIWNGVGYDFRALANEYGDLYLGNDLSFQIICPYPGSIDVATFENIDTATFSISSIIEGVEITYLDQCTIEFDKEHPPSYCVEESSYRPVLGNQCVVTFDDVAYELQVKMLCEYPDGTHDLYLGNSDLANEYWETNLESADTNVPFAIIAYSVSTGEVYIEICSQLLGMHSLSITAEESVIHPLDEKYLPDTVITKEKLDEALSDNLSEALPNNLVTTANIAGALPAGVIRGDIRQSLPTVQQNIARLNIGAGTSNFSGSYNDLTNKPTLYTDVVRYDIVQNLTDGNKTLVRANIGAAAVEDVTELANAMYETKSDVYTKTWDGVLDGITDTFTTDKYTMPFYKIDDAIIPFNFIDSASVSLGGEAYGYFNYYVNGVGCYAIGGSGAQPFVIVVTAAGNCSVKLTYQGVSASYTFTAPSTGVYAYCIYRTETNAQYANSVTINYTNKQYQLNLNGYKVGIEADGALSTTDENGNVVRMIAEQSDLTALTLKSPSGKRFKITVDDSGTISATEITE